MQFPSEQALASWPSPNYTSPETRGPANLIILSILLGVVTSLVGVRIYTRHLITHGFGFDDLLIILAYIPTTAFSVAGIVGEAKLQWDRHTWDVEPSLFVPGLKLNLAMQILFDAATNLTKLSMLALSIRVTHASGQHTARLVAVCLSAIVTASAVVFLLVDVLQCRPLSAYWTFSAEPQHCINQNEHLLAAGSINTVTDFVIAVVFPVPFWLAVVKAATTTTVVKQPIFTTPRRKHVRKSSSISGSGTSSHRLSTSQPQGPQSRRFPPPIVVSLLAGGLCGVGAGAARTFFTWRATTSPDGDVVWNGAPALLASALELNINIIVASLPAVKPFFFRFLPDRFADAQSSFRQRKTQWQGRYEKHKGPGSAGFISLSTLRTIMFQPRDGDIIPQRLPPDLNKPLPILRRGQDDDIENQDELQTPVELKRPETWHSVYDFQADADGYIRVRKASWEDTAPEFGTS